MDGREEESERGQGGCKDLIEVLVS